MTNSSETPTPRRGFLNMLLGTGTVATLGAILYPVFRFMVPPKVIESSASTVVAAKVVEIKPNQGKIFKFGSKPGILVQTPSGDYRAFSAICTHLDCNVTWMPDKKQFYCACHIGWYDENGTNISGPPPKPLRRRPMPPICTRRSTSLTPRSPSTAERAAPTRAPSR